jgi:hypothetical protein
VRATKLASATTEQLFLFDLLSDIQSNKRNRIVVCLHETAAQNHMRQFAKICRDAGLPFEKVAPLAFEVRALNQWQRVYFASAYHHPDHYAGRMGQVYLMPGIEGAIQAWSWKQYAQVVNKQWGVCADD